MFLRSRDPVEVQLRRIQLNSFLKVLAKKAYCNSSVDNKFKIKLKLSMSLLKPNKPDSFDGTRNAITVRAWLHSVERYLRLIQVGQDRKIDTQSGIEFASTFMTGTAANWWYTLVSDDAVPRTWEAFKLAVETEFVPQDSVLRARDKLARLRQKTSVSAYLSEFRNTVLDIPGISDTEKLARFCEGLKPHILLEVRKSNPLKFEAATTIALNVDGAYYGAGFFSGRGSHWNAGSSVPTPMEIGNFEGNNAKQRQKYRRENRCFICHEVGCRSWNHDHDEWKRRTWKQKRGMTNNTHAGQGTSTDGPESEN